MDLALLNLTSSMLLLTMNSNSFATRNRVMTYSPHEEPMKFRFFFQKSLILGFLQKPTRQLCSDFTIREVNGRNDYNMTMSVSDVGCRRAPQTWLNMGGSWGPDNYQNCFDSEYVIEV